MYLYKTRILYFKSDFFCISGPLYKPRIPTIHMTAQHLTMIADYLTTDKSLTKVGLALGLRIHQVNRYKTDHPRDIWSAAFAMLQGFLDSTAHNRWEIMLKALCQVLDKEQIDSLITSCDPEMDCPPAKKRRTDPE